MSDEKLYYRIGEVAEMFNVNASLIRYWESEFSVLRPRKSTKGNRMFSLVQELIMNDLSDI